MLRALLKIINFSALAFLLIFIIYFHLLNSQPINLDFILIDFETNVTLIILVSFLIGYIVANFSSIFRKFLNVFLKNKNNRNHDLKKVENFQRVFKDIKEDG